MIYDQPELRSEPDQLCGGRGQPALDVRGGPGGEPGERHGGQAAGGVQPAAGWGHPAAAAVQVGNCVYVMLFASYFCVNLFYLAAIHGMMNSSLSFLIFWMSKQKLSRT